tara:strand:+ start:13195 stop:13950 length:756 start_codon:yes stop_codon:yes gene_type:complete
MTKLFKLIIYIIIVVLVLEYFRFIAPVTPQALLITKQIFISLASKMPSIPPMRIPSIELNTQNVLIVLFLLFLVSYFSEKFRYFSNSIIQLNRKIKHLKAELDYSKNENQTDQNTPKLVEQATLIRELLEKLTKKTNLENQATPIRVKKIRRVDVEDENLDVIKKTTKKKKVSKKKIARKKVSKSVLTKEDALSTDEIMSDENISQIDLARALIEGKDIGKAKELLIKIVDSGTEKDKHEARLLYLNLDDR